MRDLNGMSVCQAVLVLDCFREDFFNDLCFSYKTTHITMYNECVHFFSTSKSLNSSFSIDFEKTNDIKQLCRSHHIVAH